MTATSTSPWIVSKKYDLAFFILPVTLSLLTLAISYYELLPIIWLWWVFTIFFDTPHVFLTYVRTYFDKVERREKKTILIFSLLWFFIGPFCIFIGFLFESRLPINTLFAFTLLYGYWHISRQHYGFYTMYQKANNEVSGQKNQLEYFLFHIIILLPLPIVLLSNNDIQSQIGLSGLNQHPLVTNLSTLLITLFSLCLFIYFSRQLYIHKINKGIFNLPKNLLSLSVFSILTLLVCTPLRTEISYFALVTVITIYHDVQYGGIVWFYSKNKYHNTKIDYGLAPKLTKNIFILFAFCLTLGFLWKHSFWSLLGWNYPFISHWPASQYLRELGLNEVIYSIFIGLSLQHYYLDQKIWKLSKDKNARRNLKIK